MIKGRFEMNENRKEMNLIVFENNGEWMRTVTMSQEAFDGLTEEMASKVKRIIVEENVATRWLAEKQKEIIFPEREKFEGFMGCDPYYFEPLYERAGLSKEGIADFEKVDSNNKEFVLEIETELAKTSTKKEGC